MTDFHSHVLPGIDDGSSSVNESVDMLTLSKQQGVTQIVATPHFYASDENPDSFIKKRNNSYQKLITSADTSTLPKIILGAEVSYFEGISDCYCIDDLKIQGTPLLLVEMPVSKWSDRMLSELISVYEKHSLIPLIAHIDRYINMLGDKRIIDSLSGLPVLIQANAGFFINKRTTRYASSLLKKGKVHLLGSDSHNLLTRKPNMDLAFAVINKRLGSSALQLIEDNEKLVFNADVAELEDLFI